MTKRRSSEAQPRERSIRNLLFVALVEEWLGRPYAEASNQLTRSERGRVNRAVAELRAIGVEDPDEIHRRALIYRLRFPGCHFTPQALAANWNVCGEPPLSLVSPDSGSVSWQKASTDVVERECERLLAYIEAGGTPGFLETLSEHERDVLALWVTLEREFRSGDMIAERVRTLDLLRRWVLDRRDMVTPVPREVEELFAFYRYTLGWSPSALPGRVRQPRVRFIGRD